MSDKSRREAAMWIMEKFATDRGFELGPIEERDKDTHIELVARTPDGREFGIGYQKSAEPTSPPR